MMDYVTDWFDPTLGEACAEVILKPSQKTPRKGRM